VRPKDGKALASEDEHKIEEMLTNIAIEIKTLLENTGTKLGGETLLEQKTSLHVKSDDIYLLLFKISAGEQIFASGGATELSILSRSNYEQDVSKTHEYIRINSIEFPYAQYADYILEVDVEGFAVASETSDADLKRGDWLFIRAEDNPTRLIGKTVAILMIEGNNLKASKKSFFQTYDHYFLRAQSEKDTSIAVVPYKLRNPTRIDDYYQEYPRLDRKFAYQIRVSGEVIGHMSNKNVKKILAEVIRQVPIIRLPEAGLGRPISEQYILAYLYLTADEHKNADFGLKVLDESMEGDDILPGDIALIHQQPTVKNGDFGVIVIYTPYTEQIGVLKRYYIVHEGREGLTHLLLESSNPSSEHLVVIPNGGNERAIESFYASQVNAGKIVPPKFYRDAEISIAGKCVGVVRNK
jgi:SOS-response transcriptional repressor LexA